MKHIRIGLTTISAALAAACLATSGCGAPDPSDDVGDEVGDGIGEAGSTLTDPGSNGVAKSLGFSIRPPWVPGRTYPIVAGYGPNAGSPKHKNGAGKPQDYFALDFGMPLNTTVHSIAPGVVVLAEQAVGNYAGYGNMVFIDHQNGYQSFYAHLDSIAVQPGASVSKNTIIGYSGRTGLSSDQVSHLHMALYQGASIVTDYSTTPVGKGPGGGSSVVPEPFDRCFQDGVVPASCENLIQNNSLTKYAFTFRTSTSSTVGSDCRYPTTYAPTGWRWRVRGAPSGYVPARLTDGAGGIWQNTQFYGCASPWRWLLVPTFNSNTSVWLFDIAAWPGSAPGSDRAYTLELRNSSGAVFYMPKD